MILHWLIAGAVILNICLGLYMVQILSDQDPARFAVVQFHKSVGLSVLVLSLVRLGWRLANPVPPLPSSMSPWQRAAAHGTHCLLYFLIIAVPLTGWALVSASPLGLPTSYFGIFHWPHITFLSDLPRAQKSPLRHEFAFLHIYLAFSAILLVPIHVAGALYHQWRGENVLRRMLPGTRIAGET
jgi:cytochrome b561